MIKVAFCITELDPGGAERALFQIVTRLDRTIFEPQVFSLSGHGEVAQWLKSKEINVIEIDARGKWDLFAFSRFMNELKKFKPDIVQGFLFQANIWSRLAGYWAKIPVRLSGIRVAEKRSRLFHLIDRMTQQFVTMNVCVSDGVKQFSVEAGLNPEKLAVIPNGVDLEKFQSAVPADRNILGLSKNDFVILSAGRLDHQKGYDFLIETFADWKNRPSHCKVIIAGIGREQASLEKMIKDFHLRDIIKLIGYRDDLPSLYKMCDLYLQTSRYEGMCNAILEALAAGRNIISTRVEGIDELNDFPGIRGVLEFGEKSKLISLIEELISNAELNSREYGKTQVLASKQLTWDSIANEYAELYLGLMKKLAPR